MEGGLQSCAFRAFFNIQLFKFEFIYSTYRSRCKNFPFLFKHSSIVILRLRKKGLSKINHVVSIIKYNMLLYNQKHEKY